MRSRAREIALQILFQVEFQNTLTEVSFDLYRTEEAAPSLTYARYLVEGVTRNLAQLDGLIEKFSHHWKLSRMALVDRNILRLATFELLFGEDLSVATIINEAIELGKKFGHTDSSGFINGILDQIAKQQRASS